MKSNQRDWQTVTESEYIDFAFKASQARQQRLHSLVSQHVHKVCVPHMRINEKSSAPADCDIEAGASLDVMDVE
jgi:hypothetical protein